MILFLESSGSKLHVKDGMFEIISLDKNQTVQRQQFAPSAIKGIWLHEHSSLTVQAIQLAYTNDVDIVTADHFGHPTGRFWSTKPNSTSLIQKAQAYVATRPEGLNMAKQWVVLKMEGMARVLRDLKTRRDPAKQTRLEQLAVEITQHTQKLREIIITDGSDGGGGFAAQAATIRGIEGASTRAFFCALSEIIPERYKFTERSRQPAKDPFNAYLNYAFAVLYARIEKSLVQAGINPYIGFMHRDDYQYKAMVYDFIEPFRPGITEIVFRLFSRKEINLAEDVIISEKEQGVKITQSGKKKLTQAINEHLDTEKTELLGIKGCVAKISLDLARKSAQQFIAICQVVQITTTALTQELSLVSVN